jgi:two-component system, sensor histidine kinase PdtaS
MSGVEHDLERTSLLARLPLARSRPWVGYVVAVILTFTAWWVRQWIGDGLPAGFPYLTFFPAVIVTAFFFGLGPGTLAAALSGLAAWFFFIPPTASFALTLGSGVALAFYCFIVGVDIALVHWMQRANASLRDERRRSLELARNRELLFSELQHRVGNNLQMIGALIALQKRRLTDEAAKAALDEAARRLVLVGSIQRQLYDPGGDQLSLANHVDRISRDVIEAAGRDEIGYKFEARTDIMLPPEKAIPTALIVAEALNNALEHGFGLDRAGQLSVTVEPADEGVAVTIADDGAGLPPGFDVATSDSLGLRIARTLAQSLDGTFAMSPAPCGRGTLARLEIARSAALAAG